LQSEIDALNALLLADVAHLQTQIDALNAKQDIDIDYQPQIDALKIVVSNKDAQLQSEIDAINAKQDIDIDYQPQIDALNAKLSINVTQLQSEIDAINAKQDIDIDYQPQIDALKTLIANLNITAPDDDSDLEHSIKELRLKLKSDVKKLNAKLAKLGCLIEKNEEKQENQAKVSPEISLKIRAGVKAHQAKAHSEEREHKAQHNDCDGCSAENEKAEKKLFSKSVRANKFKWDASKKVLVAWVSFKGKFDSEPTVVANLVSKSGNVDSSLSISVHSVSEHGCKVYVASSSASGSFSLANDYSASVVAYGK
jgi:hypothetical protein